MVETLSSVNASRKVCMCIFTSNKDRFEKILLDSTCKFNAVAVNIATVRRYYRATLLEEELTLLSLTFSELAWWYE